MANLFNDVVINKQNGGLGRRSPDQDMVSGLLYAAEVPALTAVDAAEGKIQMVNGTAVRLASVDDADTYGINATNSPGLAYQIGQYFRMNPSGDLWVMTTGLASTYSTMFEQLNDECSSRKLIRQADGEIRQIAAYAPSFDANVDVSAAQDIADIAFGLYTPIEILLAGTGVDVASASDISSLDKENVSVMIASGEYKTGVDPITEEDIFQNEVAIGMLLGAVSAAKVSENIGWVEKFNVFGTGFTNPLIADRPLEDVTEGQKKTLNDQGYIFTLSHTGVAGLYFNDSYTATTSTNDFAYIENNRTINKATRLVRTALLPKLNSPILVDPESGTLPPTVTKSFETLCRRALEGMVSNEEVSGFDVYVDPDQNILGTSQLNVRMEIVPMGTARKITVNLGFDNPFGVNQS